MNSIFKLLRIKPDHRSYSKKVLLSAVCVLSLFLEKGLFSYDALESNNQPELSESIETENFQKLQHLTLWNNNFETNQDEILEQKIEDFGYDSLDLLYQLLGFGNEDEFIGPYGEFEVNDKVRVSFINGIFNTRQMMLESLRDISETHGGVMVHNVFRHNYVWGKEIMEICRIKTTYMVTGYISKYAEYLAQLWRSLIEEMGGVEGGGLIIHYAHSLGGTDTDRARDLLSDKELQLIRVITIGSATMIRKGGFQDVINFRSDRDWIPYVDKLAINRAFHDYDYDIRTVNSKQTPTPKFEHELSCATYMFILKELGREFKRKFITNK